MEMKCGTCHYACDCREKQFTEIRFALEESIKLQSHYAQLMNQIDGGHRREFKDGDEWMKRLKKAPDEI